MTAKSDTAKTGTNETSDDAAAQKAEAKAAESFKEVTLTRQRDGQTRIARTPADLVKHEFEGFAVDKK